jgi:hypothetical protein
VRTESRGTQVTCQWRALPSEIFLKKGRKKKKEERKKQTNKEIKKKETK